MRIPLALPLLLLSSALASELEQAEQHPADPGNTCQATIQEANAVFQELQASPHAHLDGKLNAINTLAGHGLTESLGWRRDGPLATALRVFPRLLDTLLSPLSILSNLPSPPKRTRYTKSRIAKVDQLIDLIDEADRAGCWEVERLKAQARMFPPRGIKQDLPGAYTAWEKLLAHTPDPEAQFMIGLFHSTGLGGIEQDQGKAILYYTFSALQGYRPAEMALGYRHWAGIGVKEDCMTALDYYELASEKAYTRFLQGPPGGRTLPLVPSRLSDLVGGIYGPKASWASSGLNSLRPAVSVADASAKGETEAEVLEMYQYYSDRDAHEYTIGLGKMFYLGSLHSLVGGSKGGRGISAGAESVGEIQQSYAKAREYFLKVARLMWPKDYDNKGVIVPKRKLSKEVEDRLRNPAMVAAAFLGRMALRGEGQKQDFKRAGLWYGRAAELGDREALNGLGIMHRDGLGTPVNKDRAVHFFQASASLDLAEAQVNLGKIYLERGEITQALQFFETAIRHGSPFEAFQLIGQIHGTTARLPAHSGGRSTCGVSVAYHKLAAERGCWFDDYIGEGDRAWARGEEGVAIVRWLIAAEMGYEIGQNNIAFLLDQGRTDSLDRSTALRYWIRSAAQDNVDAMVKVGDMYFAGKANTTDEASAYELAANYYQTAADSSTSAMAYWNLGWMYEMGMGVPRDWHLAKRYYDLSGDTSADAWPAVSLSLAGLYLRSWWVELKSGGTIPGLRFFEPVEDNSPSFWSRISDIFSFPPLDYDDAEYDDMSGAGWTGGDGEDWEDDFAETVVIVVLALGIMGLVWLRGAWTRREQRRREQEQQGPGPGQGQGLGAGVGAGGVGVGAGGVAGEREVPLPPPAPF